MPVEVLCVGHAAYDLSAFVDGFPKEDSKCEIEEMLEGGGGPAANAAYLLSLWGVHSAFAGLVGEDRYGRHIRQEFEGVGTDVSLLELRPGHQTPFSVILINRQTGTRTIINRKAPTRPLEVAPAKLAPMNPRVLLFDGHELRASRAALKAFPEAVSVLDAGSWREGTEQLAGEVDYLVASERFALQATGLVDLKGQDEQRACVEKLRSRFATSVVVTRGQDGLIADDGHGFFHQPAFPAQAVDTTAAGDIFHGAFAFAVGRGMSFKDGLRLASMAASLSVRRAGGRQSIPKLADVEEALSHAG
jgi:sugar/nucleoside kinase (ribokinase family)